MIHSMTGFGAAAFRAGDSSFEIEVRSVNHRHLDARVRVPRLLASLEAPLRARIQGRFSRGKIDCSVLVPETAPLEQTLDIDLEVAHRYQAAAETLAAEGAAGVLSVADLLALPGVARFREPQLPAEELEAAATAALDTALDALEQMRAREGQALEKDLLARLDRVVELTGALEERAGAVQEAVRERLRKRARQLESETGLLDEARLHQEIVIAADRMDVNEELVRLRSHVDQFRRLVGGGAAGSPVGKRLDFLLQELGREVNTVGSKGGDAPIAHLVVDLKTELERLREQVQNVE